jgi:hypothetical protein
MLSSEDKSSSSSSSSSASLSNPPPPTLVPHSGVPTVSSTAQSTGIPDQSETLSDNIDTNVLSGDNQVDVEIEPDVKGNITRIQVCACTFILNCFTNSGVAKN